MLIMILTLLLPLTPAGILIQCLSICLLIKDVSLSERGSISVYTPLASFRLSTFFNLLYLLDFTLSPSEDCSKFFSKESSSSVLCFLCFTSLLISNNFLLSLFTSGFLTCCTCFFPHSSLSFAFATSSFRSRNVSFASLVLDSFIVFFSSIVSISRALAFFS
ncbi:unknown [Rickettsia prowazekii str. Madrid E]|nr:PUTATIVE PSEUDOGENE: RecName: Full=Putative uncharacterized protein RP311 [Rickettsia prowazekii str. Madrid E]CAA14772.1 unknown [Rickettsia prowazekii str. Madrid E]